MTGIQFSQQVIHGVHFNMSSAYHPQTDGQAEFSNRIVEMYLRCFYSNSSKAWIRWLPSVCYSTVWHSSLRLTPYQAMYGREPTTLSSYVSGTTQHSLVNQLLINRDELLKEIHYHLTKAQKTMKPNDNKHRKEATF